VLGDRLAEVLAEVLSTRNAERASFFNREVRRAVRLNSLYKFYQAHFGYSQARTDRQRLAFGMAVRDCLKVLKDAYAKGTMAPVSDYRANQHANQLVLSFLGHIEDIASRRFKDPLGSLHYLPYEIEISPGLLRWATRGILL